MGREEIERLQKKLAKDPDSKLFVPLAEEYRKAGMADEAITVLLQGLERQSHYLSARVALGRIYMERGLLADARDEFLKVTETIPNNLYAHKKLAEIYRALGDRENAINELNVVLRQNPTDEWAIANLSAVERELAEATETPGQPVAQETTQPVGDVPEELDVAPEPSLGEDGSAEEELFVQEPVHEEEDVAPTCDDAAYFLQAEDLIRRGRYRDAMNTYQAALSSSPGNREIMQRVAELEALLRFVERDPRAQVLRLERFLEGVKKRKSEIAGSP